MSQTLRSQITQKVKEALLDITRNMAVDLTHHACSQLDRLTNDEIADLARLPATIMTPPEEQLLAVAQCNRVARCLLMATYADRIRQQWQAESTVRDTKRVARWLKNRF